MKKILFDYFSDHEGQGLVEYGLVISLVILGVIVAVGLLGDNIKSIYESGIVNKWP